MSTFDFAAATQGEAWHPRTQDILKAGNYVVRITEIENTESSGGFPMLKITVEQDMGRQWDNLVISPNEFSVSKLMGLIDSTGVERPNPDTGEIDKDTGRLSDAFVNSMVGREVGIIVRDEEDNRSDHRGEFRARVQGYVQASVLTAATTGPLGGSTSTNSAPKQDTSPELAF